MNRCELVVLKLKNRSNILKFEARTSILHRIDKWNGILFKIITLLIRKVWSSTFIRGFCGVKRNLKSSL